MTDKELKRLKKTELLELMLYLRQELDKVKAENEELKKQLEVHGTEEAEMRTKLRDTVEKMDRRLTALCAAQGIDEPEESAESEERSDTE